MDLYGLTILLLLGAERMRDSFTRKPTATASVLSALTALALALCLAATGWWILLRRQLAMFGLVAAATLLLCDAWFDVCLAWNTSDQKWAIVNAFVEVPLAVFLAASALRTLCVPGRLRVTASGAAPAPSVTVFSSKSRRLRASSIVDSRTATTSPTTYCFPLFSAAFTGFTSVPSLRSPGLGTMVSPS